MRRRLCPTSRGTFSKLQVEPPSVVCRIRPPSSTSQASVPSSVKTSDAMPDQRYSTDPGSGVPAGGGYSEAQVGSWKALAGGEAFGAAVTHRVAYRARIASFENITHVSFELSPLPGREELGCGLARAGNGAGKKDWARSGLAFPYIRKGAPRVG